MVAILAVDLSGLWGAGGVSVRCERGLINVIKKGDIIPDRASISGSGVV